MIMEFNASIDKVVGIKEHDNSGGFFIVNVCVNVPEDRYNEFFELVKEGVCKLSSIYLM